MAHQISQKLAQKYCVSYLVLEKIRVVAYKLNLPTSTAIHSVFHVSQLKKHLSNHMTTPALPYLSKENPLQPQAILERRMVKKGNQAATQILVH
jgi:hypothetical protein